MSKLTVTTITMPSAALGKCNPLPDLRSQEDIHSAIAIDRETVSEHESQYMGWGKVSGILPYLVQDGYNRQKRSRAWKAVILENKFIRATFLPELGGRLWSLVELETGKELLHRNPVFQPCNLALRNAWISGGVEWNVGIIGHTPYTVDKLFAETLTLSDGTPVLRMYQYERVRKVAYRIEAMLPEDSHQIYVRVRLDNTSKTDTAIYWWSNMALDEREDVRVVVPAQKAFLFGYGKSLSKVTVPYLTPPQDNNSTTEPPAWDISRTTQLPRAMDFFFDLADGQRRFISAIGGDGNGFIQSSTDALRGRKLFVWGMGVGGRNWQTFLSQEGSAYLEIQAGLARTQLEHLPMKGGEVIDWMETYGPIHTDKSLVQGESWDSAIAETERALEVVCPRNKVEEMLKTARQELDGIHGKQLQRAENWAVVEKALIGDSFIDGGLRFPQSSVATRETAWLELATTGKLPCPNPLDEPASYQIGAKWEALLKKSIANEESNHWYGYYQLGVMQAQRGAWKDAVHSFNKSLKCTENPWALRCKATGCQLQGDNAECADLLVQAVKMLPERSLAKEMMEALCRAGKNKEMVEAYQSLPPKIKALGRLKVLYIEALLNTGNISKAQKLLSEKIELTDVREGEVKLTDLWFRLCAMKRTAESGEEITDALLEQVKKECPPPPHLDFRMN